MKYFGVLFLLLLTAFSASAQQPWLTDAERERWSGRLGSKLFLPALIIPATALFGTLLYNYTPVGDMGWIEDKRYLNMSLLWEARKDQMRRAA